MLHRFLIVLIVLLVGCAERPAHFQSAPTIPPDTWSLASNRHPCYLKIQRNWRPSFRVNCFQIDGDLYTHSNRFVELNNWLTEALGMGSAWAYVVADKPNLLVAIDGNVYAMRAELVSDDRRISILSSRAYDPVPGTIRVYKLVPDI